jgi:hypothetical protein
MKRVMMLLTVFAMGALWLAAEDKPVVGTWQVTSDSPDGELVRWTLTVKEESGKLAGSISASMGQFNLVDPKFEGSTFSFKVMVSEQTYAIETKVSGSTLEGSWKGGGGQGFVKGTKQS